MRPVLSPSLLLALSALFWGGHWVFARAIHAEATPVSLSFWRGLSATAVLAPFAWRDLCAVGAVSAVRAKPFFYLVPVFGTAMAWGFPGEGLQLYHLVGVILILAGIRVSSLDQLRG